jgi:transcription elongation factor Elf1
MDHIDIKYINLIGLKVQKFKQVKNNLFNFRCPICGDSQKNKTKARGYLYQVKNNTNYKCHNCGLNISFNNFLKKVDLNLHKEYSFEKFKSSKTGKNFVSEEPKFNFEKPKFIKKLDLPKASTNKEANEYLLRRKINPEVFFYAEQFKHWTNTQIDKFNSSDLKYDEPRIIIPLYYQKNLIGFQGRSIKYSPIKYITIMLDDSAPKIYGYDNIDLQEKVYVLEGPFDSTFIKNSIAMCGADVDLSNLNISHSIYVYDNEPRNKEIHLRMIKKIEEGHSIVIWPSSIVEKDINEMVLSGLDVQSVLKSNTYSGLEAKLKFTTWKKI